jgi:TPR repeat protein
MVTCFRERRGSARATAIQKTKNLLSTILTVHLCAFPLIAQQLFTVQTQDDAHKILTNIDLKSPEIKKYTDALTYDLFNKNLVLEFRTFLKPYVEKNDILAFYLYAQAHDLYPLGHGDPADAREALIYYEKASNHSLAQADFFLYKVYRYSFLNQTPHAKKSISYLEKAITHGHSGIKASAYGELAGIYDKSNADALFAREFSPDDKKTVDYLEKACKLDPKNAWLVDYLGSMYENQKKYEQAAKTYIKSDNDGNVLKIAEWYIRGKRLKKDVKRGLDLIYPIAEKIKAEEQAGADYMGGIHPIHLLNNLYKCRRLITKKQVKTYLITDWVCD